MSELADGDQMRKKTHHHGRKANALLSVQVKVCGWSEKELEDWLLTRTEAY